MLFAVTFTSGDRADRSAGGVRDRNTRIALRGKIAGEIKVDIGAADDAAAGSFRSRN